MRGYVETMERLAYNMPEGREPTDAEVCAAMADDLARRLDAPKSAMPRNPYARPIASYCKPWPVNQTDEE